MPEPTQAGGATPPEAGAMPAQTPPAQPAPAAPPAATPPATGDDALGEAGKRALAEERTARKAAEAAAKAAQDELEQLRTASQTDAEKALAQAKRDGAREVLERMHAQIRRSEVRAALVAKGINPAVLDLAVKADELAGLKVDEEGSVVGLTEAIDAFAKARADLFKAPAPAGSADGGTRGTGKTYTREQLKGMSPEEINAAYERGELAPLLTKH